MPIFKNIKPEIDTDSNTEDENEMVDDAPTPSTSVIDPQSENADNDKENVPGPTSRSSSGGNSRNNRNNRNNRINSNNSNNSNMRTQTRPQPFSSSNPSAYTSYTSALLRLYSLRIIPAEPDGNCLFRSASYLLYGSPVHHALIRSTVASYLLVESSYFSSFVVGPLEAYVEERGRDGVWGDDVEIEAISEVYGVRVEVYGFSFGSRRGAEKMRTFHEGETSTGSRCMRLSYGGGGHYDSLELVGGSGGGGGGGCRIETEPGIIERRSVGRARERNATMTISATSTTTSEEMEQNEIREAIERSRREFTHHIASPAAAFADAEAATTATTLISNSLDLAIAASIAEFEKVQMTQQLTQIEDSVLNETILQSAQTQSSAEAEAEAAAEAAAKEEEEVMRAIRLNEEEEEIRLLIINSKKAQEEEDANISEAKMIEMALKASASGGGGGGGDDDDVQTALYADMLQK